jgi:ABC-type transport system involved in cytochrome bd biosynthesis fused ATPase/permease subunit
MSLAMLVVKKPVGQRVLKQERPDTGDQASLFHFPLLLLINANLSRTDLTSAVLVETNLSGILFTLIHVCYTGTMTAEERIASLEAQLSQVLEQLRWTQEELRQAQAHLAVSNKRNEELEKQKTPHQLL